MKTAITTGLFLMLVCLGQALEAPPAAMKDFTWKHRLLLVLTDGKDSAALAQVLEKARIDIDDRDLLWFFANGVSVTTNYRGPLPPELQSPAIQAFGKGSETGTEVILIGKDGGVKYRSPKLDLAEIFARIDSMPMRRTEMTTPRKNQRLP